MASLLFYGIFAFSLIYGLVIGNTATGAVYLLGSALLPIYLLRRYEMNQGDKDSNRDQIIANKIIDATT